MLENYALEDLCRIQSLRKTKLSPDRFYCWSEQRNDLIADPRMWSKNLRNKVLTSSIQRIYYGQRIQIEIEKQIKVIK